MNTKRLQEACLLRSIDYDRAELVEVSPGIFMFYAVPLTKECKTKGDCRLRRYYAISVGDNIIIQHTY